MSRMPYPGLRMRERTDSHVSDGVVGRFMNSVYAWMCAGLALTAVVAWWMSTQPALVRSIFSGGLIWGLVIVELGLVIAISYATQRINATVATGLFLLYAAINGLTLSVFLLVYTASSVAGAFVATAGMFGAMSVVGFVTKKDLTGMGSFLMMALIGLIIASVVNMFWANSTMYWIITYAGVFIFLGLTAYDTQKLKQIAYATEGNEAMAARLAIVGSLTLYLDFINLFLFMLRILGSRRE